jgi:hypothetical protein
MVHRRQGLAGDPHSAAVNVQTLRYFFVYGLGYCVSELQCTSSNTQTFLGLGYKLHTANKPQRSLTCCFSRHFGELTLPRNAFHHEY